MSPASAFRLQASLGASWVKRRLRLELYYAKKFGIQNHLSRVNREWTELRLRAYFRGWIDYLHSVPAESAVAQRLRKQLDPFRSPAPRRGYDRPALQSGGKGW